MEKLKLLLFGAFFVLLAGCGQSANFTIDIDEEVYFKHGDSSPVVIRVTDEEGPAEGLKITGNFQMANMDHGIIETTFKELGNGIYSGDVEFAMSGEWEMAFTIEKDGKTIEKVIKYNVQDAEGVALINGEWITEEDLEFYRFINKLHIAINRERDKATLEGKELENALTYWDNQEKLNENQNTLLTQIIRLRAMAALGSEKGHKATNEEIQSAIENVRSQYAEHEVAEKLINEFGKDKFWQKEEEQYALIILSQKVQTDLINEVKAENPGVNEQEIMFLAQKQYEELLVEQVNTLKIKIL